MSASDEPSILFTRGRLGDVAIAHRVATAPLTHNRATPERRPAPQAAECRRQRASAHLIITDATQISPMGKGYLNTLGLHDDVQAAGPRASGVFAVDSARRAHEKAASLIERARPERWQSGQMQRTVNPSGKPYAGSNPALSTTARTPGNVSQLFGNVTYVRIARAAPRVVRTLKRG